MRRINTQYIKTGLLAAGFALCSSSVFALDLGNALGSGMSALKGATLTDADVIKQADEACKWMDTHNKIAPASNKYGQRLAKLTNGLGNEDGLKLNFKVYLVVDVNAFAMANGCVRVFAGLMDIATDDEIRAVIGHEIGHAKLGHTKAKMRTAMLTRAARQGVAASDSKAGKMAASELGGLAEDVVNAQFSQAEESEADVYGYHFMVKHRYDPNAMVTMLSKLEGKGGLTSSHPSSADRVAKIKGLIKGGK
jgi:putative metalloprotease